MVVLHRWYFIQTLWQKLCVPGKRQYFHQLVIHLQTTWNFHSHMVDIVLLLVSKLGYC